MRRRPVFGMTIAEVSRQTGIPTTTLRFYEKELPGLLPILKTRGGHRRYRPEDVAKIELVRRLTSREGVPLSQVRGVLTSRGDHEPLREDVRRLGELIDRQADSIAELAQRLDRLEEKLEVSGPSPGRRRRRWFRKGPPPSTRPPDRE
jgi:DNA-binding transcriptional MerR regulator